MSNRIDRKTSYFRFHLNARAAMCRVMNATERARLAEALHPSRQANHLDESARQLDEAMQLLARAIHDLSDMRKFRSYEERKENK